MTLAASSWLVPGCPGEVARIDSTSDGIASGSSSSDASSSEESQTSTEGSETSEASETTGGLRLDLPPLPPLTSCDDAGADCTPIDVLFVVDNSAGMAEAQRKLAASMPGLVERLQSVVLPWEGGRSANASVNVMFTTTDMGHPLCNIYQPADYTPQFGSPVVTGCNTRINRFTGLGEDPPIVNDVCTDVCRLDAPPDELRLPDPFVRFDPFESNVEDDRHVDALACLAPQGIDGCGYEAPLESMWQALHLEQCWNDPDRDCIQGDPDWPPPERPFLRDGSTLVIVIVTDETECSVVPNQGHSAFMNEEFWEVSPDTGNRLPTSAVCWNASVACDDVDGDGTYEACISVDHGVLHPVSRYVDFLESLRRGETKPRNVVMLGILGVPEVLERDPITHLPTAGGLPDLVERDWIDAAFSAGGDLPDPEWLAGTRAAHKRFDFGAIAPGCTARDEDGTFRGQGLPSTRITEVCQSLDFAEGDADADGVVDRRVRCCIESICTDDFAPAFDCVIHAIEDGFEPPEL